MIGRILCTTYRMWVLCSIFSIHKLLYWLSKGIIEGSWIWSWKWIWVWFESWEINQSLQFV
jgi:hypothetical protein